MRGFLGKRRTMANIVNLSDFDGTLQLQMDNFTEDLFDSIRNEWEPQFIYKLLGAELGGLFISDLDASGVPVTARFTDIFEAFQLDYNCEVIESLGIKEMIKSIIWFYFARNNNVTISLGGNNASVSQNSVHASDHANLARNYNKAIRTARAIQHYIRENSTDYPEYNGQYLRFMDSF